MQTPARWAESLNGAIRKRPWLLPVLVAVIYGSGHVDFKDFQFISTHPFDMLPDPGRQFLYSSPFIFFAGWPLTHVAGPNLSYLVVTLLGFAVLATAAAAWLTYVAPDRRATLAFVVLSSPLLLVLLRWLGKSDSYLIAFYLATLRFRDRPSRVIVFGVLMLLAHREIATVMLVGDVILRRTAMVPILVGGVLGQAIVRGYMAALPTRPVDRIDFAMTLMRNGHLWTQNPIAHLMLGPGWLWIFIGRLLGGPDGWRVAAVLVLCFAAAANTSDFTRDFILCAVPLVIFAAERIAASPDAAMREIRWPALFLVQAQIWSGNLLSDTNWSR